jgi:hypothetical protein
MAGALKPVAPGYSFFPPSKKQKGGSQTDGLVVVLLFGAG